jgi:predicted transcriptional regulator
MKLSDIQNILDAQVLCGDDQLDKDVHGVFACDLISEMLLYVTPKTLVITSLTNIHVVHTAHVMDAIGVVFVGGKKPDSTVIANSEMSDIPLFTTNHLIFECCGRLYAKGMKGNVLTLDSVDVSG